MVDPEHIPRTPVLSTDCKEGIGLTRTMLLFFILVILTQPCLFWSNLMFKHFTSHVVLLLSLQLPPVDTVLCSITGLHMLNSPLLPWRPHVTDVSWPPGIACCIRLLINTDSPFMHDSFNKMLMVILMKGVWIGMSLRHCFSSILSCLLAFTYTNKKWCTVSVNKIGTIKCVALEIHLWLHN